MNPIIYKLAFETPNGSFVPTPASELEAIIPAMVLFVFFVFVGFVLFGNINWREPGDTWTGQTPKFTGES